MKIWKINLHLFEGEGGAAAAGATDGATESGATTSPVTPGRAKKAGAYDNVVFGKQPDTQGEDAAPTEPSETVVSSKTLDDKRKAWSDLINGEYKDMFTEDTQKLINRRFKETKNLQGALDAQRPIIDKLMSKYKVNDISKLSDALDNDDAYWEAAADEAGMSIEQYKQFQKLEQQNQALLEAQRRRDSEQKVQAQAAEWYKQFEDLKAKFPGIDPNAELANPRFTAMLRNGVPVADAYGVIHMDDIVNGVIKTATSSAEKRMADNIRARGQRPKEGAASSRSAFTVKDDVSKLTKADRAEAVRRAARGETISW